jgi:hypothetical protein
MTFEQEVSEVDGAIQRDYLDLVVNYYRPLFEKVKTRATKHMGSEGIPEIDLGVHSGLVFRKNGQFYNGQGITVELRDLPRIYQEESDYIAVCADSRSYVTPSVHSAMRSALSSFRDKVKKSLSDVL